MRLAQITQVFFILVFLASQLGMNTISAAAAPAGKALQFNGTSQYVTFGAAAGASALGVTNFTIEAWVQRAAGGTAIGTGNLGLGTGTYPMAYPVVTKGRGEAEAPANVNMNYFVGIATTGVIAADFEDTAGGVNHPVIGTNPIPVDGQWHHIAVSYDGQTWRLYRDGIIDTTTALASAFAPEVTSIQHAAIATAMDSTGLASGYFAGAVDEVRIWNTVRTAAQIQTNKNAELTSGTGLIGRWGLNEGSGAAAANSIAGRPNGTVVGSPTWVNGFPLPDSTPPAAPTALTATPFSGSISLSWTAPADLDVAGYNVYRSTSTPVSLTNPVNGTTLVTGTTYSDGGLTNGTRYYYVVTAVDTSTNQSVASNPANAIPLATLGSGLSFDGTNDYVTFGPALGLDAQNFTVETWFKRTGPGLAVTTGNGGVIAVPLVTKGSAEAEGSNVDENYILGIRSSDNVLAADFETYAICGTRPAGDNNPIVGVTPIANDTWYHAAFTYDGAALKLYLNGNLEATLASTCLPRYDSIQHAALGTYITSAGVSSGYFQGVLDEVRIWNTARTQAQIMSTINSETTSGTGLLARWGLNEGSGTTIASSIGAFPGTLTNGTGWTSGAPFNITPPTIPTAPTGLLASATTGLTINLGWTDNSSNETSFKVERSPDGTTGWTQVGTAAAGAVVYSDGGLNPLTQYCYRVRASNGAGDSGPTNTSCATTPSVSTSGGLGFDGTNDYVTFGNAAALGLQNFTVETWFMRTGTGIPASTGTTGISAVPLVTKGSAEQDASNVDENYILGIQATTNVLAADFETYAVCGSRPAGDNNPITGITPIVNNTWYHAAFTYDGAALKLYLNGNLEATVANTCIPRYDSIQHAGLGTYLTSTGVSSGYFQGSLDEVRIWNTARTQAQIMSSINSELTSGTGLVARWGLNEGSGTTIASSMGTIPGTLTNGPTWTTGAPFNIAPPSVPAAPTLLSATPTAGLAIDLGWTDNSTNETSFKVERAPIDTGPWTQVGTAAAGATAYSDSGLDPATQYCYRVRASNSAGDSPYSNISCADTAGTPNNGLNFGSSNAYATFGNPASIGLTQFTIETWFKRVGTGVPVTTGSGGIANAIPLVTKGTSDVDNHDNRDFNYFLGINSDTNVLIADFEEGATGASPSLNHPVSGTTTIVNNTWYHAAATYDGSTWKLYLNGNLQGTLAVGQPPRSDNTSPLAFGSSIKNDGTTLTPQGYFNGNLDEVRIWNVARTQAEIQGTLNSAISSPQAHLVGRWGLDETSGTAVPGSAGTTINGTITGTGSSWGAGAAPIVNHAPAFVSGSPAEAATGVSTSPTLTANFSDTDLDAQTVSFYGHLKGSAGSDFTLAVIPDPQYLAASYPAVYNGQMQWVVSNKTSRNIPYVIGLGDNVDDAANNTQWTNATTAWDKLTTGGIPYGIEAGNHDGAPSGTAAFNTNFGSRKTAQTGTYGGRYGTADYDNYYTTFSASGMDFIVVFIEYDDSMTSTSNPVLTWANGILSANPTKRAIVVTHNLLQGGSSNLFSAQGQAVYDALKANPNLFLMMGGHLDVARRRADTFNGHTVYSLRSDYQFVDTQSSGYLRIMRFSPADNAIHVSTYSPNLNQNYPDETPPQNAFDLPYDMGGSGSFTLIGTASNIPAGTDASISWPGLTSNTQYEWYATSSDGRTATTGPTRSFTTQTGGVTCYALTLSHTGQGTNPVASPANSTGCAAGQYVSGATISLSGAVPTSGWQIASWTGTNNDASTGNTNIVTMPASVRTASVNYTALPNHTVTFNANLGTGTMSNQVANVPTALTLNTFTRAGYSFSGWNTNAGGTGTPYANGATYSFAADVTLFAQWAALTNHTVTFNANLGTGTMSNQVANVPTALTLNTFTRAGYSFSGWNTNAAGTGTPYANGATYSFAADVTLFAQWAALTNHTVTFNANLGTGSMSNQVANVPTALTLNTFTRTGFSFSGWNTNAGGTGTSYANGATYPFAADVTLFAQWTALPPTCYALTLSHTGQGTNPVGSPANSTGCAAGQYVSGASISLSGAVPTIGWQIASWTGTDNDTSTASTNTVTMPASVRTASVNYTALPNHTVTFNANGGTGSMSNQIANVPTALTLNSFTRAGFSFSGWNTAAGGTGTAYANGATYSFTADITLFAQWTALPNHTVTFNANGGTGTMSDQVANVPTALTLNTFTRAGYSFNGWNTQSGGGGTSYANGASYPFAADVTLFAQWTALPPTCYALTLSHTGQGTNPVGSPANSTGCAAGQYVSGASISLSGAVPTIGWQISSWTGTDNDTSTASTNTVTMPASAHTAAVNYTQIGYTLTVTSLHGTVVKNPNKTSYAYGEMVQLKATPAAGWKFSNWTGGGTGSTNPILVTMNGNKSVTANYTSTVKTLTLRSVAGYDGWVLESSENSNLGGSLNSAATVFNLGDDAANKQYRAILSFNTAAVPDNAVITSVTLKVKKAGQQGAVNPFITLGNILVDIKKGNFGTAALQAADFQTLANKNGALTFTNPLVSGWYSKALTAANFTFINKVGSTQFRLRFTKDDNNNHVADYLKLYSGNAPAASQPVLVITYYVP